MARKHYDNVERLMWIRQYKQQLLPPCCGVAALCILLLGNRFANAELAWPVLACIALIPTAEKCTLIAGLAAYAASALIAALVGQTEGTLFFVVLGSYPIFRPRLERTNSGRLRAAIKIVFAVVAGIFMLLLFRHTAPELLEEMTASGEEVLWIVFLIAGGLYFFFIDAVLVRLTKFYLGFFPADNEKNKQQ